MGVFALCLLVNILRPHPFELLSILLQLSVFLLLLDLPLCHCYAHFVEVQDFQGVICINRLDISLVLLTDFVQIVIQLVLMVLEHNLFALVVSARLIQVTGAQVVGGNLVLLGLLKTLVELFL